MRTKKGFTLVELVVVIAILAILAAIAIPAVISIVNHATESALQSEAASIDQCCKTYYEEVKTGMITADKFKAEESGDVIPVRGSSLTNKSRLAKKCTVGGALEYNGMRANFVGRLDEFAYDVGGNIIAVFNGNVPDGYTLLDADGATTYEELGYVN